MNGQFLSLRYILLLKTNLIEELIDKFLKSMCRKLDILGRYPPQDILGDNW